MPSIRYHVAPRDAPPAIAARKLGLTLDEFSEKLPALIARGFPAHDKTTGKYDLRAIDEWQNARYPHLFGKNQVIETASPPIDPSGIRERLKALAK